MNIDYRMMDMDETFSVEYVKYEGMYPSYCSGRLTLMVNGVLRYFGPEDEHVFWTHKGICPMLYTLDDERRLQQNTWKVSKKDLPLDLLPYAEEIEDVLNKTASFGCRKCLAV